MNLARGLIGAAGGYGVGMVAVGTDQMKKNAELAKALREEAMQEKGFRHAEALQQGGFANAEKLQGSEIAAKKDLQESEIQARKEEFKAKGDIDLYIAGTHNDVTREIANLNATVNREQMSSHEKISAAQEANKKYIADMENRTKQITVNADLDSTAAKKMAAIVEAYKEAGKVLKDTGEVEQANAVLRAVQLPTYEEYEKTPGKKGGWFSADVAPEKGVRIEGTGKGLISDASAVNAPPAPPLGKSDLDSLLEKGRAVSGKTISQTQGNTVQSSGVIGSEKTQAPTIPDNLPSSLNDLDSMVKKLPAEMDGIYKKSPSWERGRNISEGVSSVTGQSQATQNPDILRKGEDNLTKAIRIATGKTDIYELNIIADKLQTIYKGKLSDAQLANLIKEGKLLGNRTGA